MKASYKSACGGCGERIDIGDEIHWHGPEIGARCEDCGPHDHNEPAHGASTDEDVPGYVAHLRAKLALLQAQVDQLGEAIVTLHNSMKVINRALIGVGTWAETLAQQLGIDGPEVPDE